MVEVSLTIGKLDASLALLLTKDHHLIEFPTILLPNGVKAGSIVKIKCDQDLISEQEEAAQFEQIQQEILSSFATNLPQVPKLRVKNVTQTSCVLEWDQLDLGTANLKNLILFKDGKKLGSIPSPSTNKTSKLSGLPIDKSFKFQLRLDTTAGTFLSDEIEVNTHKMTDLSGITVCLGDFSANDPFTRDDIEETLRTMGAKYPPQDQVKVDTTHFLCTRENKQNAEYIKANEMNIPIIRPEWLKACERERRIVGVRDFYVKDCVLPDIFAKNYWKNSKVEPAQELPEVVQEVAKEEVPAKEEEKELPEAEPVPEQVPAAPEEVPEEAEAAAEPPQIEISHPETEDKEETQKDIDDAFGEPTSGGSLGEEIEQEEISHSTPEPVTIDEPQPVEPVEVVTEAYVEVVYDEDVLVEDPQETEINVEVEQNVAKEEPLEEVALDAAEPKVEATDATEEKLEQVDLEETTETKVEIKEIPAEEAVETEEVPLDDDQEDDDEEEDTKDPATSTTNSDQDKKKKRKKKNKKK
ncbi:Chitin biosynthesis protein CHS5 [Spathaspora sp. JA1]|nr:Chitin biosynthesis protein CHS5 [Spathaspora sp. JA1]